MYISDKIFFNRVCNHVGTHIGIVVFESQSSDWALQNNDSVKNNNAASRRDESWEINRVIEQPGYIVSQTVKVGQVNIEATRVPAVAQQK